MLYSRPAHMSVLTPLRLAANVASLFVRDFEGGLYSARREDCHFWQSHLPSQRVIILERSGERTNFASEPSAQNRSFVG
jgi:hypothetical protein